MIAKELREIIQDSIHYAMQAGDLPRAEIPEFVLERPRYKSHGHWATNAALVLSGEVGRSPREIAETIVSTLKSPRLANIFSDQAGLLEGVRRPARGS